LIWFNLIKAIMSFIPLIWFYLQHSRHTSHILSFFKRIGLLRSKKKLHNGLSLQYQRAFRTCLCQLTFFKGGMGLSLIQNTGDTNWYQHMTKLNQDTFRKSAARLYCQWCGVHIHTLCVHANCMFSTQHALKLHHTMIPVVELAKCLCCHFSHKYFWQRWKASQ